MRQMIALFLILGLLLMVGVVVHAQDAEASGEEAEDDGETADDGEAGEGEDGEGDPDAPAVVTKPGEPDPADYDGDGVVSETEAFRYQTEQARKKAKAAVPWYVRWGWVAVERLAWGVFLVFLGWLAYRIAAAALGRVEAQLGEATKSMNLVDARRRQHVTTILDLIRIITTAFLVLDQSFGLDPYPYLAGAGVIGVAVAFGCQSMVKDVVTGIFQLLEGQYSVGDYVQIGAAFGKVEDVGLRVTRVRDIQDKLYFIPNGTITMVTTYDDPSVDYVIQVPIDDPAQAEAATAAVLDVMRDVTKEFPEYIGEAAEPTVTVSDSGATSVRLKVGIVPTQDWIVTAEIPGRIKQILAAREIATPAARPPMSYLDISPLAKMPLAGRQ